MKNRDTRYLFSSNFKRLRKAKGWNQTIMAEKLGIKQNTVSNYESGHSYPDNPDKLAKIIEILDTTYDILHSEYSKGNAILAPLNEESTPSDTIFETLFTLEVKYPDEALIKELKNHILTLQLEKSKAETKLLALYERLEARFGFKFDD